jgi:pilus assembly protein CpaD
MGKLRLFALLTGAALLAGCGSGSLEMDDTYTGSTYTERYPIRVAKAPMKLEVASSRGGLRATQVNAVVGFARSAEMASASQISLRRPSGGGASASTARQVYNLLIANGVSPRNIHQGTYRASGNAPVLISFTRMVAVTKECGDWSSDLANTPDNQPYSNFGCAVQQNTAAMVQNPADFEVATPSDPVNAPYRIDLKKLFPDN